MNETSSTSILTAGDEVVPREVVGLKKRMARAALRCWGRDAHDFSLKGH